jgi:hypothetical protein
VIAWVRRFIVQALLCCGIRGDNGHAGPASDRSGEFSERRGAPLCGQGVDSELVLSAAQILQEGMPGNRRAAAASRRAESSTSSEEETKAAAEQHASPSKPWTLRSVTQQCPAACQTPLHAKPARTSSRMQPLRPGREQHFGLRWVPDGLQRPAVWHLRHPMRPRPCCRSFPDGIVGRHRADAAEVLETYAQIVPGR